MRPAILSCFGLIVIAGAVGCDRILTDRPSAGDDFESPLEGMSHDLNAVFALGDENFERAFTVSEGLGPIFNNTGCEACHPADGRGTPQLGFVRFSRGAIRPSTWEGRNTRTRPFPECPAKRCRQGWSGPSGCRRRYSGWG